jgi:uncharacterized protein
MSSTRHRLSIASSETVIAAQIELADSAWKRSRGLLGRASLGVDEGMRFEPASSLHMWFMRFAIDVIYVDRDERVVKLVREFKPWRMSWAWGTRTAYELPVGSVDRAGVVVGDVLELRANERVAAA